MRLRGRTLTTDAGYVVRPQNSRLQDVVKVLIDAFDPLLEQQLLGVHESSQGGMDLGCASSSMQPKAL